MYAEMNLRMRLRENIQHLIDSHGMSIAALARASGVPKTSIGEWLSGSIPRDIRKLKKIADHFGILIDSLCFDDLSKKTTGADDDWSTGIFEVKWKRLNR